MSKRILYIRENLKGGTDNYCKALYHLFKDDNELCPLPVTDIPAIHSRLFHYYYRNDELKAAIREADIVHINGYTALGSVQAMRLAHQMNKRIVYTAHWHPFRCLRHPVLGELFFRMVFLPMIKRYANVVTAINQEDYQFFSAFHHHVVQIPHWYQPLSIQPVAKKPDMVLFVGRTDDPVKGIEHLYQLPEGQYEVHCVGKGNVARKDFHQHIGISDAELARLYAEASLVVVPSKYEAFSYAALEAMSYGTPVLMSERVRIADYLQGIKGYQVFRYGDMHDFLTKLPQTIGSVVDSDKVRQIFNPATIRHRYRSIYLNI